MIVASSCNAGRIVRPTDPHFTSVKLLLSAHGTDGAQTSRDESQSQRTITSVSGAVVSATAPKFAGSMQCNRTESKFWSVAHSTDFNLSGIDYTIDFWLNFFGSLPVLGNFFTIFSKGNDNTNGPWLFAYNDGGTQKLYYRNNGVDLVTPVAHGMSAQTWNHIEVSKTSTTHRIRKNGVTLTTGTGTLSDSTSDLKIGSINVSPTHVGDIRVEDFRWTSGVQRNASDFTPPTSKAPLW